MRTRTWIPVAAALVLLPAQAMGAPPTADGEWTAFYGCWRVADAGASAPLVCVLPGAESSSVRIATIVDGEISEETVVRADGQARSVEDGGCSGTEAARFSADGRRVYTRAELACGGLGRTTTGVLALVSEEEWVDAQALTVNGQHASRIIRYRVVSADEVPAWVAAELPEDQQLALEAARMDAATPLDVDAVIEASGHVAPPAVEALLAERRHGYGLNGSKLARLAEANVPTSTIDLMVALSYPTKFVVEQQRPVERSSDVESWASANSMSDDNYRPECRDPYTGGRRYGCDRYGYGGYGYMGRFGYSPYGFGYSPYGYDRYGWNYGSTPIVIIQPGDPGEREPRGGQVVKGQGYTRSGAARGTATPRGTATTRSSPSPAQSGTPRATGSSSGSGSSTAGSSSSGGSSSEPTRTAKPRGGGN